MHTVTSGKLLKSTHMMRVIDVGCDVAGHPRTRTEDHFKAAQERGVYDENILRYYTEYFPAYPPGHLKMCEILTDDFGYMDIARAILGLNVEDEEGTVDEVAEMLVTTGRTFSIGQVEKLVERFDAGEKNIQLSEGGQQNVFILSDEKGAMDLLLISWNGRAWRLVHDGGLLVNKWPKGTRLFLLN